MAASSETVEAPERETTRWLAAIRGRQVDEERRRLDARQAEREVAVLHRGQVLGPDLLHEVEAGAQVRRQPLDGLGHDLAHHLGALAAAEHQQPQRGTLAEVRIRDPGHRDHRGAERVTGVDARRGRLVRYAAHVPEAGGDGPRAAARKAFARPITAFCSCRMVGTRRSWPASIGGTVG